VSDPDPREELRRTQASLVAALVAGAPTPPGFDERLVRATAASLRVKRAGEVAHAWPALAASLGPQWMKAFSGWAEGRPPAGSVRDGWDLARDLAGRGTLADAARVELATREVRWRYAADGPPQRRRLPAVRRVRAVVILQLAGRVRTWRLRRDAA
jgi:hypothetical protein